MSRTSAQVADTCRLYLTLISGVTVLITVVWATARTLENETTGTPGMPVVSVQLDDAALSSSNQGSER